jgi:AcrR family transcriptional regulator
MPKRDEAHMQARRREIMDAAVRCFVRNGLAATTIADIRNESGLSTGGIYLHFGSKAEIVAAVGEHRKALLAEDPALKDPAALPQWAARRLQDVAAPENRGLVGLDFEALAHPEQSEGVAQIIGEILRDEQKKLAATLGGGADGRARAVLLQAFLLGAGMLSVADAAPVPKLREALDVLLAGVGLAAEKKPAGKKNTP